MGKLLILARRRADWLVSLLLIGAVLVYAAAFVDFRAPPFEDAAMLMRYADHLAHGYGVVWNIGEKPVDGATDFLFMAATAALIKAGVAIGRSVRILGFAAHVMTVLLVYWGNRLLWKAGLVVSAISALYLAVGTGLWYVAAFFGTTFFAFFAALTWIFGLVLAESKEPPVFYCTAFAFSALITGLIRPEGVILAAFFLVAILIARGLSNSARIVVIFGIVMLVLGGAYFAWHWRYFGYPLPNPFYKKGGGLLHADSFWESLGYLFRFGGPFMVAFLLGLRSSRSVRRTVAFLLPLALFAAAFVLVSNETNFGGRFQYALWPLVLISYYPLIKELPAELGISWPRPSGLLALGAWSMVAAALLYGLLRYSFAESCSLTAAQQQCGVAFEADGRYDVAKSLAAYQGKGYVMATTEAGLLPLYSGWSAVDAWGLNDAWIAHHGDVTPEYLDRFKPELIVFHAYYSPLVPPRLNDKNLSQDWFRMTITLKNYAEMHGYVLAAAFGDSPYESHYYYVRPDFPDSGRIIRQLAEMRDYRWPVTGRKAINYATLDLQQ